MGSIFQEIVEEGMRAMVEGIFSGAFKFLSDMLIISDSIESQFPMYGQIKNAILIFGILILVINMLKAVAVFFDSDYPEQLSKFLTRLLVSVPLVLFSPLLIDWIFVKAGYYAIVFMQSMNLTFFDPSNIDNITDSISGFLTVGGVGILIVVLILFIYNFFALMFKSGERLVTLLLLMMLYPIASGFYPVDQSKFKLVTLEASATTASIVLSVVLLAIGFSNLANVSSFFEIIVALMVLKQATHVDDIVRNSLFSSAGVFAKGDSALQSGSQLASIARIVM